MKKATLILTLAAAMLMLTFAQPAEKEVTIEKKFIRGDEMPTVRKMNHAPGMNKRCGDCGMRGEKEGFGPMIFEKLELNIDQISKIEQIKIRYKKMNIDFDAEKEKLRIDRHQAMKDMNFSEAKNIVKKISDVRLKIQSSGIDEIAEITKILTKEQLEKFKEIHGSHFQDKHKMKMKR